MVVLRSDALPKQELKVNQSRKCSAFFPHEKRDPIDNASIADANREDKPWNRYC